MLLRQIYFLVLKSSVVSIYGGNLGCVQLFLNILFKVISYLLTQQFYLCDLYYRHIRYVQKIYIYKEVHGSIVTAKKMDLM